MKKHLQKLVFVVTIILAMTCAPNRNINILNQSEIHHFEKKYKMTILEAFALIQDFVAQQPEPKPSLPLRSAIVVNNRFLFPREAPKIGGVRERGFYVDPVTRTVIPVDNPRRFNGRLTSGNQPQ
jgi:hypothetical protein